MNGKHNALRVRRDFRITSFFPGCMILKWFSQKDQKPMPWLLSLGTWHWIFWSGLLVLLFWIQANGARIGWARHKDVERFMGELISSGQENYDDKWQVWVDHRKNDGSECSALRDYKIHMQDCDRLLPYICERGTSCKHSCRCLFSLGRNVTSPISLGSDLFEWWNESPLR